MMRTHYCGSLTEAQIDQTVTLCGWVHRRRDHGGVIFLDMRDRDGLVQVVIDPDTPEAFATADKARATLQPINTTNREVSVPAPKHDSKALAAIGR